MKPWTNEDQTAENDSQRPTLFENLLSVSTNRLHNIPCPADCGDERRTFARCEAHVLKVSGCFGVGSNCAVTSAPLRTAAARRPK
jgi:hypothetical protein